MTHPNRLAEADAAELKQIRTACPHLDAAARHVRDFAQMMHDLHGDELSAWMDRVLADELPALHSLVNGLRRDLDAVATVVKRAMFLAAVLIGACAACTDSGGEAPSIEGAALVGSWTNEAGARLTLDTDRQMTGTKLHEAILGGTSCPDSIAGQWAFFSPPDDRGTSHADHAFTRGDAVALRFDDQEKTCLLSAQVHRDEQGFNLCLMEDPDSECSAQELLRPTATGRQQTKASPPRGTLASQDPRQSRKT
ncbi:hypothetical protein ACWCXB_32375 [Streptomyces sp. NPDC001514]